MLNLLTFVLVVTTSTVVSQTPLDDYVNAYDPHYGYVLIDTYCLKDSYTVYILNMTSQKWLNESLVDRPVWWHYLTITVPHNLTIFDTMFLYITGGSNNDNIPDPLTDEDIILSSMFAYGTGSIGASLKQIPNQPITFLGDVEKKRRTEDAIIAYTWWHFLKDPTSPEWLLRLPMTKAVVRAVDTVIEFSKHLDPRLDIKRFMPAGASKRGWTTWTTGVVDKRAFAIAPIVLDILNTQKNLHHHFRSLGGWTFAFEDYWHMNITQYLDDPNFLKMAQIIDPLSYKDRLTMPKYIITSSGDEFFLPDDSHYYFDMILGEKYLKINPNAEHSLIGHYINLVESISAFYLSMVKDYPRPKLEWKRSENSTHGNITMTTDTLPLAVTAFRAKTIDKTRRDYRLLVATGAGNPDPFPHPVVWLPFSVKRDTNTGVYLAEFEKEKDAWVAFFIQATFPGPGGFNFEFTTEVNIIPDTFPFAECSGKSCIGTLV